MAKFTGKFESAKQEWTTPRELFEYFNAKYTFQIDLAASPENTLCKRFFTKDQDALQQEWEGSCWLNPPYGSTGTHKLSAWIRKAWEAGARGSVIAVLLPARTNTSWWHKYCMKSKAIYFLEGRPKFGGAEHGLPQPLAVVIFAPCQGDPDFFTAPATGVEKEPYRKYSDKVRGSFWSIPEGVD